MYFAKKKGEELLSELQTRVDQYYNYLNSSRRIELAKTAINEYYVAKKDSQQVRKDRQGRLRINVSELQNSVQYMMSLLANQPSTFAPVAENGDSKSQNQVKIAKSIIDYYMDDGMTQDFNDALEMAIVTTECHGVLGWDKMAGEEYAVEDDKRVYQGDVVFSLHDLTDTIRDVAKRKKKDDDWFIIRHQMNKYELAARYPKHKDKIEELKTTNDNTRELNHDSQAVQFESDMVYYYEFRHKKNIVLPGGRRAVFIEDQLLDEGDLPYDQMLVYKMSPKKEMMSNFSWTNVYDLVAFQQSVTKLYSVMLTNLSAFGYQSIVSTHGANVSVSELGKGLRHFKINPGEEIKALDLTKVPQEVFTAIDRFEKKTEILSGMNSVVKGQPEASLKSGAALALVASQAVAFLNSLDESFNSFQENVASGIVEILKIYANTPRLVSIAGVDNSYLIQQEFTKDKIAGIRRVRVERVNPLSKTISGRVNLAEMLLQQQQISPQQYINVINTGQVDELLSSKSSEVILIKSENEALRVGKPAPVLFTDNHPTHIAEHLTLLNDPVLRQDPELVKSVLDHVQEHKKMEAGAAPPPPAGAGMEMPQPDVANPQVGNPVGEPMMTEEGEMVNQPAMPNLPEGTPPELAANYEELQG